MTHTPATDRLIDLLIEPRPYEPDGPTYVSLRLSGLPIDPVEVAVAVSIPGPRRDLVIRTWDGRDPVRGVVARHRLGGMLAAAGNAHTARLDWSPAYELTLADGGRFPPGTHVEVFGRER